MEKIVCNNYDLMSKAAAEIIKDKINSKKNAVLGLATGSTPVGTYKELINMYENDQVDFSEVRTVNLDEYIGLDGKDIHSYRYFMNDTLFDHININKENTHVPDGTAQDLSKEASDYDQMIDAIGGVDIQILGIGNNGHIAFNEPDKYLKLHTHVTDLTLDTINANKRFFDSPDDVPRKALTMGIGQIMKAKRILLLANGKNKAEALKGIFSNTITTDNPATLLQLHKDVTVIIDKELEEEINRK